METITIHDNWDIKPLKLSDSEKYIEDINYISLARTGFIHAWESNLFFEEACQLIVNAIRLFQRGYYDCAFYSLRQSIETSIGIIYLTANPDKENEWKMLCDGFDSGAMSKWLREYEPTFMDVRNKMSKYFDNIRNIQLKLNKYVHKQGFASFYKVTNNPIISQQKEVSEDQIQNDFRSFLKVCIGAVSIYRLTIDALPVVLMDEDIRHRTPDLITEPYSQEFIDKYIGSENLEAFKTTEIYKITYESFRRNEKQNDAVYGLIHFQYYNRKKRTDYEDQLHLCSFTDKVVMCLCNISNKISNVFVNGIHWYSSDVRSNNKEEPITMGLSHFNNIFVKDNNDYNQCYHNVFLSRCQINENYTYFEHNEKLDENEIECVRHVATQLSKLESEINKYLSSLINNNLNQDEK
ncbi:MAG: hypothetical protein IK017_09300 [Paludibacteraceae bacterium]|nr:hypothetical protein [Paludibacteraceae bacterium]